MPDLSKFSHVPEDKKKNSIYLSWDKDFIALAKKTIQIMRYIFFFFLQDNMCSGYSLEEHHRGASNEYLQYMFSLRNKNDVNSRATKSWLDK